MAKSDWVRSVRKKLGLKGFQLAELLGVSAARVSVLEKDEARGAVTLKMMDKAAKAMGCRFEYQIVPDRRLAQQSKLDQQSKDESSDRLNTKPRYRVVKNNS